MLQGMTVASPPAALMPSATSWHASALREETTTLAPSLSSSSAGERPEPPGGAAEAAAGAGDHGDLAGEIERGVFHCCWAPLIPLTASLRAQRSNPGSFGGESLDCFVATLLATTAVALRSTRHRPPRGAGGSRCHQSCSRSWSGA